MAAEKVTKAAPTAPNADKKRAIETAMAQIEKLYGKGSIMRCGDEQAANVEAISTGSLALDLALGIGGLPKGRIVEIYGPESSGKTTLALHVLAQAQKAGGEVAFIDAEHALDIGYARALGVNVEDMLVSQPDTGEQALEITEALVRSGAIDVIVVDSVAALVPRAEIEGEMGDSFVGLHARLMSQALRKLAGAINKTNCIVIFINQLREKVGVMYGNPEVTTGGRALKFYASVRIDVRRIETLKNGSEMIGNRTRAKVVKNKVAPNMCSLSVKCRRSRSQLCCPGCSIPSSVASLGRSRSAGALSMSSSRALFVGSSRSLAMRSSNSNTQALQHRVRRWGIVSWRQARLRSQMRISCSR